MAEGNRRLCALKLLNDPDLAPPEYRKEFHRLAQNTRSISEVECVVFEKREDVEDWLELIHGGAQGGIVRRQWTPDQKNRHLSDKRYQVAQRVLDYAEKRNYIASRDRKSKLTTAQRYLGNPVLRDALGLDVEDAENLNRTRPAQEFEILLQQFVKDLLGGTVHSRSKADDIHKYARSLASTDGVTGVRVDPEPIVTNGRLHRRKANPKEPRKPEKIAYSSDVAAALEAIPSYKLSKIYYSLCSIKVEAHTTILSVAVWAFLETLTSLCKRNSGTSFDSFLNRSKLNSLGFTTKEDVNSLRQIIERISGYGNTDKHHDISATFNSEQLTNDVTALERLICQLATEAGKHSRRGKS